MNYIREQSFKTIKIELNDHWVTIWLNRPEARNALSQKMIDELTEVCKTIALDTTLRGVAFRGMANCFCSGADLKELKDKFYKKNADHHQIVEMSMRTAELFKSIHNLPQISVALVNGPAFAGGFGIVSCVDFVIATQDSKFSISETKIGLVPAQIAPYIIEKIGIRLAKKLMLTGVLFDGSQAYQYGVVDEVLKTEKQLNTAFLKLRGRLCRNGPHATATTKAIINVINHLKPQEKANFLANKFADCLIDDEAQEGISAFSEKRTPNWVD